MSLFVACVPKRLLIIFIVFVSVHCCFVYSFSCVLAMLLYLLFDWSSLIVPSFQSTFKVDQNPFRSQIVNRGGHGTQSEWVVCEMSGDIFVLYSHCLQQLSCVYISWGRGPSLSTSLMSHTWSHDLRSRNRSLFEWWTFCRHVLDSNMTFSERELSLLKQ